MILKQNSLLSAFFITWHVELWGRFSLNVYVSFPLNVEAGNKSFTFGHMLQGDVDFSLTERFYSAH